MLGNICCVNKLSDWGHFTIYTHSFPLGIFCKTLRCYLVIKIQIKHSIFIANSIKEQTVLSSFTHHNVLVFDVNSNI